MNSTQNFTTEVEVFDALRGFCALIVHRPSFPLYCTHYP